MVWRALLSAVLPALNKQARRVVHKREAERWDECVQFVQMNARKATSAMYVRRHSSEDTRNKTIEMVQDINKEMHHLLESVEWMDPKTRCVQARALCVLCALALPRVPSC